MSAKPKKKEMIRRRIKKKNKKKKRIQRKKRKRRRKLLALPQLLSFHPLHLNLQQFDQSFSSCLKRRGSKKRRKSRSLHS
jgi:hypothetical protein